MSTQALLLAVGSITLALGLYRAFYLVCADTRRTGSYARNGLGAALVLLAAVVMTFVGPLFAVAGTVAG